MADYKIMKETSGFTPRPNIFVPIAHCPAYATTCFLHTYFGIAIAQPSSFQVQKQGIECVSEEPEFVKFCSSFADQLDGLYLYKYGIGRISYGI